MKYEYLLFNLIVLAGPLAYSFERTLHFRQYWRAAFPSIAVSLVVYVLWDAAVTNRHWYFNPAYMMDIRILKLPIEEWLFFVTVPYACLFVREALKLVVSNRMVQNLEFVRIGMFMLLPIGIAVFQIGKEYTGLVLIAFGIVALLDRQLQTHTFLQTRTYIFLASVIGFTCIFNMYLTARPLLIYAAEYQLGCRIITIPVEDFGYGVTHIALCNVLYEYCKLRMGVDAKK
ncbi:MAG: lycopene cyclase domain-containing protein [Bacteroidota bacterium]|nr:lycopene cyclase domain-containing protein [Candidatus Kapabacteria bacterium]MDW8221052.1 lycopene cyclase domain-containing protein [Bacteroidota bacterium]